jgi:hypothetical protein
MSKHIGVRGDEEDRFIRADATGERVDVLEGRRLVQAESKEK